MDQELLVRLNESMFWDQLTYTAPARLRLTVEPRHRAYPVLPTPDKPGHPVRIYGSLSPEQ